MTSKFSCLIKKSTHGYKYVFYEIMSAFGIFDDIKLDVADFILWSVSISWLIGVCITLLIVGSRSYPNTILNIVSIFSSIWLPVFFIPIYLSFYNNLCEHSYGFVSFINESLNIYYESISWILMVIISIFKFLIPSSKASFIAHSLLWGIVGILIMLILMPTPGITVENATIIQKFIVLEFLWLPIILIPFYNAYYECYCVEIKK